MKKRILAVFLALVLLVSAVPHVFAEEYDNLWLIYYEKTAADAVTVTIVAPAKYTRISDDPRIETIFTEDLAENVVSTPDTEQIPFYFVGKTETRWTMTLTCAIPDGCVPSYNMKFAVLPDSALDAAGNGNERICFEDGVDYQEARGYTDIDAASGLLLEDYSREDSTIAVGDTLRVGYSGLYPVEIFLNGQKAAEFPAGEMQSFTYNVTGTGTLNVSVRQGDRVIASRSMTVITSKEMYKRNLRDGLITREDIPTTNDLVDVGVPRFSIFIPLFKFVAFCVAVRIFFTRLFSFTRIVK